MSEFDPVVLAKPCVKVQNQGADVGQSKQSYEPIIAHVAVRPEQYVPRGTTTKSPHC